MTRKKRIIYSGLLFILLLPIGSCVERIAPHLIANDPKPMLVVEGLISNEEGPFSVKLTNTVAVSDIYTPKPVLNADVRIIDDQGNSFQLFGDNNGIYETSDKKLKGVPGNRYTLSVTTTDDNRQYISTPVLMQEVPDIDNVYFEEVTHPRIQEGKIHEDNWLNILLDSHDPEGKNKYWRFDFKETWEVNLLYDVVKVSHSPTNSEYAEWQTIVQTDDKKICWVTKPSASILLASTVKNPVDEIKRFTVQSIGPGDTRLHIRYSILVKQYSIDADLYNYLNQLKDFNENSGGIYNKIPAPIFGNISCCDGTAKALGYFSASSVKEKRLFIKRSEHHIETINSNSDCTYFDYDVSPSKPKIYFGPEILSGKKVYATIDGCSDCTLFGTNVKPTFW